jgi:hypothetical protein
MKFAATTAARLGGATLGVCAVATVITLGLAPRSQDPQPPQPASSTVPADPSPEAGVDWQQVPATPEEPRITIAAYER